jgi:hypothetical protein
MATTDAAEDPVREAVERWLHAVVSATIALPAAVVAGTGRCLVRRSRAVGERLMLPGRIARSLFELAWRAAPHVEARADPVAVEAPRLAPALADDTSASVDATALPIDEYESLAASQVVARLPSLTAGELDVVRRFEAGNRGRRTVIGKIDQLLARA